MRNSKNVLVVRDFLRSIPEEIIRDLHFLLDERKSGDVGEVVEILQEDPEMDKLFAATETADGIYDVCDEVHRTIQRMQDR